MSLLLIPVAPLSKTKSRLRDCFTKEQLKDLTIAMFKDLTQKLLKVKGYREKIVYCNNTEILEIAEENSLTGIKEVLTHPPKSFDAVITDVNHIAMQKFDAQQTTFSFLDTILISPQNFEEISVLIKKNQIVVCPAIHSGGISVFGRNPPDIMKSHFSHPHIPSLVATITQAKEQGLERIEIYDSFRAGFDIDIKQDLVLTFQYLKIFNLTHTETYKFLKNNLKLTLQKDRKNNRKFEIVEETKRK